MPVVNGNPHGRLAIEWYHGSMAGAYDEMLTASGEVRPHWQALTDFVAEMGSEKLARRRRAGRRMLRATGIGYEVYGDSHGIDRPWPFDPIPLMIDEREWQAIENAIIQRARLLNLICAGIYGSQRLVHGGLFPAELIFRNPAFLRPCRDLPAPEDLYLHVYSADLVRTPDGQWRVLADHTQAPSGAGYALANRLVTRRVLPDLFRTMRVPPLAGYFQTLGATLRRLIPRPHDNPRIVLLTPGPYNESYFEHAFLARCLGYTLVEGGDLTVRGNHVFLKTPGGLLPIDLIIRRQDDTFCDPLELQEDSMLGVPGLVQAARSGNVVVANALGSGLLQSPAHAAFLPPLCRHLLGEDLQFPGVATWWCGEPQSRDFVTANLAGLIIRPAFPDSRAPLIGANLDSAERERLIGEISAAPADFIAQERISPSTAPVWEDDRLAAREFVLRVYAVAGGGSYVVMPGGLTRMLDSPDGAVASALLRGAARP